MKGLKIALIASSVLLTACETMPDRDPEFAPVNPGALRPPEQKTGSIYQSNYDMRLFEDHTAKRIGDIITVLLNERTQARKDANTEIKKEMDFEMAAPTLAGVDPATFLGKNIFSNEKNFIYTLLYFCCFGGPFTNNYKYKYSGNRL